MELEKDFFLPDALRLSFPGKYGIKLTYDDFKFKDGYIPVNYEYQLDMEDIEYLLHLMAADVNLNISGDIFPLFVKPYYFVDEAAKVLSDYVEYPREDKHLIDNLKEHCKTKAYSEFLHAFEYWVDKDDREEYSETEDFQ